LTGLLFQNPENHFLYNQVEKELSNNEIDYLNEEFESKKDQSPFTLSEGEKRRLSTAIAYQKEKQLLLLDEPTFGQDYQNKVKLIELLGKLRDNGIGIVIVSHDESFVKAVSNRIFELKNGILTTIESQNE
jgi:energy-coupling factor transport system ATP-binding protein